MKKVVVYFLILFLLCSLNLSVNPLPFEYRGFVPLVWKKSANCVVEQNLPIKVLEKTAGTFIASGQKGFCESENFTLSENEVLEIEYFNTDKHSGKIEILDLSTGAKQVLLLPDSTQAEREESGTIDWPMRWRMHRFSLDRSTFPNSMSLKLIDTNPDRGSLLALRGRINKYTVTHQNFSFHLQVLCYLILFVFLFLNMRKIFFYLSNLKQSTFFFLIFFLSALLHFRFNHYFYWDEWHTLEQFFRDGFAAAFHRHNEHRVPLLFLFYFAEICLYRDNYSLFLLTSYALHALNSLLLAGFCRRILNDRVYTREVSFIAGFFYAISALHAEVLRWAIDQASLICLCLMLLSLNSLIDFVFKAKKKDLLISALSAGMAPLFFGNGFSLIFYLALLLVFYFYKIVFLKENFIYCKRLGLGLLSYLLASLLPISVYLMLKEGEGFNYSHMNLPQLGAQIEQIKDYLVVGSQFATALRGLGLFYTVSQEGAYNLFGPGFVWGKYRPEEVCAFLGIAVSALLFVLCIFSKEPKRYLKFWFFGQLLILACFLLPALARSRLGSIQSLALRYQTQALIGLVLLLLPWMERLYKILMFEDKKILFVKLIILFYIFSHLQMSFKDDYFSARGLRNRNYLSQLEEWQEIKQRYSKEKQVLLEPLLPANFTPKRTPAVIDAVWRQLRS